MLTAVQGARRFLSHTYRAVRLLARDQRVPRPVRGLIAFGVLPIPGPADEVALLIVAAILAAFYRAPLRDAWQLAGEG